MVFYFRQEIFRNIKIQNLYLDIKFVFRINTFILHNLSVSFLWFFFVQGIVILSNELSFIITADIISFTSCKCDVIR